MSNARKFKPEHIAISLLVALAVGLDNWCLARGGFGGGGFRSFGGGGYRGDFGGNRGDYGGYRGDRGDGDFGGRFDRGFDAAGYPRADGGGFDRGSTDADAARMQAVENRVPQMQIQTYGTGGGGGSRTGGGGGSRGNDTGIQTYGNMASDGGFGRIMGSATGQGGGANVGVATAQGRSYKQGMGTATAQGRGYNQGMGTATAQGQGYNQGMGTATAQGRGYNQGMGTATAQGLGYNQGMGTATAQGRGYNQGMGTATAQGRGYNQGMGTATAQGRGYNQGMGTATAQGRGYNQGMGTATAQGIGHHGNFTTRMSPADLTTTAGSVRQSFNHYNYFGRNWWSQHPASWYNRYWDDYWPWGWTAWGGLAGWWGMDAAVEPVYYDYGDNITYDNDTVYYGSQPEYSAATYYQQAQNLALSAPPQSVQPNTPQLQSQYSKEWKPLGVFALVANGSGSSSSQMMQLCVNKAGTIRGNYYNALTNQTQAIRGSIDKKSMRACWVVGNNKNVVYDTGVGNLLKNEAPILVHYSAQGTQQFMLVRLQNPNAGSQSSKS